MTKKCGARLCIPGLARHFFRHFAVLSLTAVPLRKVPIVTDDETGLFLGFMHFLRKKSVPVYMSAHRKERNGCFPF